MFFINHRKIFYVLIGALSVFSVVALFVWGLVFGIEFTGGTIVEVSYNGTVPEKSILEGNLNELNYGKYSLRQTGDNGYILRMRDSTEDEYQNIKKALSVEGSELVEKHRASVGPTIGGELKNKALVAISIVVLLIVLYVAFAFRNVRDEDEAKGGVGVSSWVYGFVSILVLVHDVLVPLGMFSLMGYFWGAEVDVLIVTALLTILGYSVNDTIIIFDRVRENLKENREKNVAESFAFTVGKSLSQTYARSINTSFTTLMVVLALLVFGGPTTMYFALTLSVGILAGTYSSLAIGAPLLVTIEARQKKNLHSEGEKKKGKK